MRCAMMDEPTLPRQIREKLVGPVFPDQIAQVIERGKSLFTRREIALWKYTRCGSSSGPGFH